MKISNILPKIKKETHAFQPGIEYKKPQRWFNFCMSVFLIVTCLIVWIPKQNRQQETQYIPTSEYTFVKTYLTNKISTNQEAVSWARSFELSKHSAYTFNNKSIVKISSIQILSATKDQETTIDEFEVSFIFKMWNEKKELVLEETQFGKLFIKEINTDTYIVYKGFEYIAYTYNTITNDMLVELESSQDKSTNTERVETSEQNRLTQDIAFFFDRYNTNFEQAKLMTAFELKQRGTGYFSEPVVKDVGYNKANDTYSVTVAVDYILQDDVGKINYIFEMVINKTTNKIISMETVN